jgi:hypothetical protein
MTITDLITQLQSMQATYGDVSVELADWSERYSENATCDLCDYDARRKTVVLDTGAA